MPVLESVAASLRAMMPDLPMPVTMTRPVQPLQQIDGSVEILVELGDQPENGLGFGLEDLAGDVEDGLFDDSVHRGQLLDDRVES